MFPFSYQLLAAMSTTYTKPELNLACTSRDIRKVWQRSIGPDNSVSSEMAIVWEKLQTHDLQGDVTR